jgi:YVTN family beta-propeller protein
VLQSDEVAVSGRPDARLGSELAGYRLEAVLGRGGMGAVYRAEDVRLGRKVAVKVIAPELAHEERFRERFLRETRIAASLDHPHIVPIHGAGEADGSLYLAMRYVEGTDLARLIAEEGPLEPGRALALMEQIADALDAAHERGLVHRDVKPSNILLTRAGGKEHAYLSDFGLTKQASSLSGLTISGQILGTLDYVAPEQIQGETVDGRADVYALACVLHEGLTGTPPFPRATEVAILWAHVHDPPPAPSSIRPELPPGLDHALERALAKEPDRRTATSGELVREARAALAPAPSAAPRRPFRAALVAAAALLVGAAAAAIGVLALGEGTAAVAAPPNSVALIDPAENAVVAAVQVGVEPQAVAAGDDAVWVGNRADESLSRVDPATRALVRGAIPLEDVPTDVTVAGEDVWVALGPSASVSRVSVEGNVAARPVPALGEGVPCGRPGASIAVGGGFVWFACGFADLGRLDLEAEAGTAIGYDLGILESANSVPPEFSDIAYGLDRVWLLNRSANEVIEIDTNRVPRRLTVGQGPVAIAVGENSLWIACFDDDTVWRVDIPGPGQPPVSTAIPVGDGPADVAVGDGAVWVVNRLDGTVSRIDPDRNEVVATIEVGHEPRQLAAGAGGVWVTVGAGDGA